VAEFPSATGVLAGTFSPDGKWIVYYDHAVLNKVSVDGGAPIALAASATVGNTRPSWGADDTIVFTNASLGLSRVKASGGDPQVISTPDAKTAEMSHELPFILPDGKTLLYDVHRAAAPNNSGTDTVVAQPLDGGPRRELFAGAVLGIIGDDRLVLWRDTRILSLPFDTKALRATGEPTPLVTEPIAVQRVLFAETALFSVAPNGMMVYAPAEANADNSPLTIVDRSGHAAILDLPHHRYSDPRVSPDGERIVVHGFDEGRDNWVVDVRRGTLTRLTTDPGEDETPIWSPDGRWVYWSSTRANVTRGIFRRASDGSGNEELLWTTDAHLHLGSVTPDGGTIIFSYVETAHRSISALRLSDKKVTPLVTTPFMNVTPVLSPDGRWLAYVSNESGRNEVYVQPFPSMQGRTQVSASGGIEPQWSRRDHELLYRSDGKLMAVDYAAGMTFDATAPRDALTDAYDATQGDTHTCWDVFPDGRFVFVSKPAVAPNQRPTLKILVPR
jgi:serine/threonine-protein kinase